MKFILLMCVICYCMLCVDSLSAGEIGYDEEFSLARDRSVPLKQLIPGTEDYYYYNCLYHQMRKEYDQVDKLLKQWIDRYSYTERVNEIRNRQELMRYPQNERAAIDHIIRELDLRFNHEKKQATSKESFPSRLDPSGLTFENLKSLALRDYRDLSGFEPAGLERLTDENLDPERRRDLLSRMTRPAGEKLAQMVLDDLNYKHSGGFGSLRIHNQLLQIHLDYLAEKKPELLYETNFVLAYLRKLHPGADENWQNDSEKKLAFLRRMFAFVEPLSPVFNSLRAHLLYHILDTMRVSGSYDKKLLFDYLKLPRSTSYINAKMLNNLDSRHRVDLGANYSGATLFRAIGNDEQLIRDYLQILLKDEKDTSAYAPYIESNYLQRIFAETKILNGIGDMEKWFSLLGGQNVKSLKDRIELELLATNKEVIGPQENVELNVRIKNVKKLIVKIYKLNLVNYYRENLAEVSTAIDLDGLVANEERAVEYDLPEYRRHDEKFSFPELKNNGVYVVELIGNGMSSRALIRRGQLSFVQRPGAAGHVFTVFNDSREPVRDATILMNGQLYKADEKGLINIPFSSSPGERKIVISQGDFASLHSFNHEAERYNLNGSIHVDREALVSGKNATVIVRPSLSVNSFPVDVKLLTDVTLNITSTDREGVESSKDISDFQLYNDQEASYTFRVPEKLSSIRFVLKAKIENLSQGKKDDLSISRSFSINGIEKTEKTHAFYVRRDNGNHIVELLGKTGEPCAAVPVNIEFKPRLTRKTMYVTLQTDDKGRLYLGKLEEIDTVSLTGPENLRFNFSPAVNKNSVPQLVCTQFGNEVMIPLAEDSDQKVKEVCSLFEIRAGTYVADFSSKISIADGCLKITGLPAGDYELFLKNQQQAVQIKIADGKRIGAYTVSVSRALPVTAARPMQIASVKTEDSGKKLKIRLVNAGETARVHVIAGRFLPEFELFEEFASVESPMLPIFSFNQAMCRYLSGRNIGDEYRYILERRYAKIFPGNMLRRPGLLLNPWSLRKTDTQTRDASEGGAWAGAPEPEAQRAASSVRGAKKEKSSGFIEGFATLDFLSDSSVVLSNLKPDAEGNVEIDLSALNPRHNLQILAVDRFDVALREVSSGEISEKHQDLRLAKALPVDKHFSEQKNISVLKRDEKLVIEDITTSKVELYDSVASVYRLLSTVNPGTKLSEFSFICRWPNLSEAEKLELYSKYSCHELNFFLYQRDRSFFDKVIKPYIVHKRDKTFMDKWLLGENLNEYLDPWSFSRLNIVEKILLGKRLPDMTERIERHVVDLFDLLPDDRERFNHLFKMALSGSALETSDNLGFAAAKSMAVKESRELRQDAFGYSGAVPAPSMAPPAPMALAKRAMKPMAKGMDYEQEESIAMADEAFDSDDMPMLEEDSGRRREVRQLFRQVDKTEEWVENNYYQLPIEVQVADLIKVNGFWKDYACHKSDMPFVSANIAEASSNLPEMMMALAVIDLPFKAEQHSTAYEGAQMTLRAAGNVVIFHEEIRPAAEVDDNSSILTGQNFFAQNDRYRYEKNERFDKFVTEEFLVRNVYGCQVVLTNPTSSRRKVDLLMQIPAGAIPVMQSHYTRSIHMQLEPYSTRTAEYYFYFPFAGKFAHYPAHVSDGAKMLATTRAFSFNVVNELTSFDKTSWPYVSQNGSAEEVLDYLEHNNVERFDLELIAFRMKNRDFFSRCYELLKKRQVYNHTLWSYGIMHRYLPAMREFLEHSSFVERVGSRFESDLLTVNPVERHFYQHKEYWPLVNARVYPLGKKREILNDQFAEQYRALMADLRYRDQISDYDRMAVVYYLLLQDRIEEAAGFFVEVKQQDILDSIQYKYFKAYFAFSNGLPEEAAAIAAPFKEYPVIRWQNLFSDVLAQVAEVKGAAASITDKEDRDQKQRMLAATQPDFELSVENRSISLRYSNIDTVRVNFYLMDIELMFSRKPFVQEVSGQFSIISPNYSVDVALDKSASQKILELPEKYRDSNVLVEVTGAGLTRSVAYYPHSLAINLVESYGQIQISHQKTGKPVSKAYVKVYARNRGGDISFYKDGYTDLRGKFDYASLSTSQLDNVERFAILIMTDDSGSVIREAAPPAR